MEQREDYWMSPQGITRRIKFLAQDFTYKSVNGAIKLYGDSTKNVMWLKWETVGDDRVCVLCLQAAAGGRSGFYKPSWFMPSMPKHAGDRCQWVVYYKPEEF